MTEKRSAPPPESEEAFSRLFQNADLRPAPPHDARERAFSVLEAEWRILTLRRRRYRHALAWGLAACLLIAVVGLNMLDPRDAPLSEITVATVVRSVGNDIRWTRRGSPTGRLTADVTGLAAGQSLSTGPHSRLALRWHSGGSLRVDENTRIELVSPEVIRLIAGGAYFDSAVEGGLPKEPTLSIETPAGRVTHLGTQFMTRVSDRMLSVAVREGTVRIDGGRLQLTVEAGRQLEMDVGGVLSRNPIATYGDAWQWVEEVTPVVRMDGRTARELLDWVARETGRTVVYESAQVEAFARDVMLHGMPEVAPMQALRTLPYTTDLRYELIEGRIRVRLSEAAD